VAPGGEEQVGVERRWGEEERQPGSTGRVKRAQKRFQARIDDKVLARVESGDRVRSMAGMRPGRRRAASCLGSRGYLSNQGRGRKLMLIVYMSCRRACARLQLNGGIGDTVHWCGALAEMRLYSLKSLYCTQKLNKMNIIE
jgi:hypothetical protein